MQMPQLSISSQISEKLLPLCAHFQWGFPSEGYSEGRGSAWGWRKNFLRESTPQWGHPRGTRAAVSLWGTVSCKRTPFLGGDSPGTSGEVKRLYVSGLNHVVLLVYI